MYGYHVNWVPGVVHPGIFENKVTMAARLRLSEWVPMGWMPSGVVEHWHFMVVLARVSLCNARVENKALLCEHAKLCWDTLKEDDRHMVLCGHDGREDENMWSMHGAGVGTNPSNDFPHNRLSLLRRRYGWTTLLGWVPIVCPMHYASGADLCMIFRNPLGVSFFVTYSDGLLRHIQYMSVGDMAGNDYNAIIREPEFEETAQLTCEVNGPPQDTGVGCDLDKPAANTSTGCGVVDKSTPACGTMRSDGSRRMGQGTKRKATTRREYEGTTTVAERGGGGNGSGGGGAIAGGRGRGRGRGQGGTTMDGETKRKIGGRQEALRRNRQPGQASVAEMRRLQRNIDLCIAYRPFVRLVREIVNKEEVASNPMRFGMLAVRALLEAAEAYLVHLMENTNEVAIHSKRVRILTKDMRLVDALQKPLVEWMCNDGDINMSKREGGGLYDRSAFKKFVRSQAKEAEMLKVEGDDELKPNAAEILTLSKINALPQIDPIDYHDLTTMVVDGVEYVLIDQIVDFMKSGGDYKNLIHEALHDVTEEAIAAAEVVNVECAKDHPLDLVSGTLVCQGNTFEVLEELTAASTDVDRRRKIMQ
ncbi:hypothetical protein CBR_g34605 [Chara braunii]|uniref:Core Histone H2A/H2B/H3 domain-containing protein n=1 Tax=Chara braunii TaxID=69332 RepID=A0A388LJC3_CHABU|nr:hypothetical protein CBR_g34605 [Chara braunii]|eukprot:GBG82322.1 hypothetical protein CBR_g34605 [Chara braunii]